jgi:hypothetical protein
LDLNPNVAFDTAVFGHDRVVILLGDLLQLPAVIKAFETIQPIHRSKLFLDNFRPFFLNEIVRQHDPDFVRFLNNCRINKKR